MKKLLLTLVALTCMQFAYADGTANINIRINGASGDNRYFLCIPNIGCLSILAAQHGKVFPIIHSFEMQNMFITNLEDFRVHPQGLPSSCKVNVDVNHTLTITGQIVKGANNSVHVQGLHCNLS